MTPQALTLFELNRRVGEMLNSAPTLTDVWVVAETSDVRTSGGHCYLELIDKNPDTGAAVAKMRAMIWASRYARLNAEFRSATGSPLTSDIKVMVRASVSFHPVYGISLNITDINPEYTLGDLLRRRREMISRLQAEGIIDCNRSLQWPRVAQNIAVISAAGAAGYGDFINQLYGNSYRLRFSTRLFPAVMQGDKAAPSIIAALGQIAAECENYDCVVIIRGGGATGDLAAFDNYDLAAHIALFPLPVIIGIGHERDVTLLDYVANLRVKTPTAAAEWLVGRGVNELSRLTSIASEILNAATAALTTSHRRLDTIAGQLQPLTSGLIARERMRVGRVMSDAIAAAVHNVVERNAERLKSYASLLDTLSPEATLRRGFSVTRIGGRAVTDASQVAPGSRVTTTIASGSFDSIVK